MDEELARKLELLINNLTLVEGYLNSIRKMLKFFVILTVVACIIVILGRLFG